MKTKLFFLIAIVFTANLFPQSKTLEIKVKNDPWTTGDIWANITNKKVYEGDIYVGNESFQFWVDMRGWAEFDLPSIIMNKQITKVKLEFYILEESDDNNNMKTGSHNLVITKFPFDVKLNSPWDIVDYFDELEYNDSDKIYGINWEAGESKGTKEVTLEEKAIEDFNLAVKTSSKFRIGFWEFNDNASKCTIAGKSSAHPPKLIVEYH